MIERDQPRTTAANRLGKCSAFGAALLCASMASSILAEQQSSRVQRGQQTPAANEASVLVATREAPPSSSTSGGATGAAAGGDQEVLLPIAQSSDFKPEVASNSDGETSSRNFSDALVKVAQPAKAAAAPQATSTGTATRKRAPLCDAPEATSCTGTARRAASARANAAAYEPVKFQGIAVGKTSKHELVTAWGQPAETNTTDEGEVLVYHKLPFKAVEALVGEGDVVNSIKITLAAPLEAKQLAGQLGLDKLDPVTVTDETEAAVCCAYPERGVLFMFEESETVTPVSTDAATAHATSVAHVALQPIDSRAFAYRAESRLHGPYARNIADLKAAIALDPEFARAYWLLAKIYIATGQADLADAAATEACDIEPKNASFQLCRAEARELLGEYDDAVLGTRAVLDREDITQIDRAQALHQMARLASLGDQEIASKTTAFETRAIEIADKLATSKDARERRAAKQLLVEAHMGVAEDIARQPVNGKVETLSQWIGRASGLAEDYIATDHGSVELRLFIAQRALGAMASFKPTLDPTPWVAEAEEAAKTLLAQSDDEIWQQRIQWDLGIAYLNALRVEHTRRQTEAALRDGQLAIDNLAVGASGRQAVHSSEQMVGQLYFQMGAVYAVHKLDHNKAVHWYDKAAPLITAKRPASELYAPRREGEMLVSMGVSYWQLGNQTKALDLTQTGVGLVETAVDSGVLEKSTLAVPYSNLSSMYQQMGENTNAAKYAAKAKSVASTDAKSSTPMQPPRIGRGRVQRTQTR